MQPYQKGIINVVVNKFLGGDYLSNNIKRFLGYFLYMVFIGLIIYWNSIYQHQLQKQAFTTFKPWQSMFYMALFPIVLGILLALPQFISTVKKSGSWCMDWVKLLGVSMPALYITFHMMAYFSPVAHVLPNWFMWPAIKLINSSSISITVFGIIFGYTLLTVLKKRG